LTDIYVDGDACPVREEIYRVATRLRLNVLVVSNGSRPIRPPRVSNVSMVLVGDSADAADDWIAERIGPTDVCVFRHPAGITLSQERIASRLADRKAVDRGEYRKRARWSRDSPASAGAGGDYARANPVDQERQVPVP
jgi:hypothetical protein